jgi:hypothetical protein
MTPTAPAQAVGMRVEGTPLILTNAAFIPEPLSADGLGQFRDRCLDSSFTYSSKG